MKYFDNILIVVFVVLVIEIIKYQSQKKIIKNIENYNPIMKTKFKATEYPTEYSKMIIGNANGDLNSIGFPKGIIVLWSGSIENIPDGWSLCNGVNNTPDLRGRFVLGVNPNNKKNNSFTVNEMLSNGGEETVKLQINHLPKHSHPDNINELGEGGGGAWYNGNGQYRMRINNSKGFTGDDQPHNNMPPYYTLAYIMKII
jgi:hypothetical protein